MRLLSAERDNAKRVAPSSDVKIGSSGSDTDEKSNTFGFDHFKHGNALLKCDQDDFIKPTYYADLL
jgi:hypothetical protein